jgi:hypothetical protein
MSTRGVELTVDASPNVLNFLLTECQIWCLHSLWIWIHDESERPHTETNQAVSILLHPVSGCLGWAWPLGLREHDKHVHHPRDQRHPSSGEPDSFPCRQELCPPEELDGTVQEGAWPKQGHLFHHKGKEVSCGPLKFSATTQLLEVCTRQHSKTKSVS